MMVEEKKETIKEEKNRKDTAKDVHQGETSKGRASESDEELLKMTNSDATMADEKQKKKDKKKDPTAFLDSKEKEPSSGSLTQTDPPSVPLRTFYPDGHYPIGEIHSYGQQ